MNTQRILVQLDALLDTRLATVSRIDQDAAVKLLESEAYYIRFNDDFEALTGITREQFRDAYAKRDVDTLALPAIMTVAPLMLHELITKLEINDAESPYVEGVEVEVNFWPYQLDDEEIDGLSKAIMVFSGMETLVRMVSIHPMELTPDFIKDRYTGLILYDFKEWFEYQKSKYATVKTPDLTVLAPALFYDKIPTPEEYLAEGIDSGITPFELAELAVMDCFRLKLLKSEIFSIRSL